MRQIALLVVFSIIFCFTGCEKSPECRKQREAEKIEKEKEFDRWHGFKVRVVDSCEYIIRADKTDGVASYARGFGFLAHKGNCKFCEKRDSINREKQKKEIVNEILNTLGYGSIE